jgi:YD repeat-containing protein
MLRPSEIDRPIASARRAAAMRTATAANVAPSTAAGPGGRRPNALPSNPSGSGSGINPWWRYQEQNVPGGGHVMVNVGTGNLLLQGDDMSVPHKGIALAFRRTYNSQSLHDVNASDAGEFVFKPAAMYGNGWTNTFDAHLARNTATTLYTVFDIDGARYDYDATWPASEPNGVYTPRAGNHATLVYDGNCGYLWTKKTGTTYYFYRPGPHAPCPQTGGTTEGYTGRLYQIIGRNRNTYLTFSYSWDGGISSLTGKVSQITVQTESGLTATLSFADVSGHRLLQQLTLPDGITNVSYGYNANGDLTSVSLPPNNTAGIRPQHIFGYAALGSGAPLSWAASPRFAYSCNTGCGNDGGWLEFGYAGAGAPPTTVSSIAHVAVVNPSVPDGTGSGALQPGYATVTYQYLTEYYTTGVTTPTYRDTDGHMTNWVVDGSGRPTQTQECAASINQGQQCTGMLLIANETWDASNNLIAELDPRGYQTDYAYDANGNAVAVAAPQSATAQGTFRPTKLYDYDAFNNVVAYCDEDETHRAGADWLTPPAASDTLCSSTPANVPHWRASLAYPSYQPFGQLASTATPLGYTRRFTYGAANQGGADFGLPTALSGDPITQRDGTVITPTQTFWYDGTGNLRCYSKGIGTYVLSYDVLGHLTSEADPDDSSANASSLCGKTSGQPGWNTQVMSWYFPDGSKRTSQTPSERPYNVGTYYTYDLDGNVSTEASHHGCTPNQTCAGGITQKWYDGADRLVEIALPHDISDLYSTPWLTRYIYDLSGGANVAFAGNSFPAYGNLYKTQEYLPGPVWQDTKGNAFDGLDRPTVKFAFSPSSNTTVRTTTSQYDHDGTTYGLLWRTTDPRGETTTNTYSERGSAASLTFAGDGGVTPNRTYTYDANNRLVTRTSTAYGTEYLAYDDDGRLREVREPTGGGLTSPAVLTYAYYGDGSRKTLSVASAAVAADPLLSYSNRVDGARTNLTLSNAGVTSPFGWTYTDAGRELSQADPFTNRTVNVGNDTGPIPGSAVRPRTDHYNATGQLDSLSLPGYPNFGSITHDPEGSVMGYASSEHGGVWESAQFAYTVRGEAAEFDRQDGGYSVSTIVWQHHIANGAVAANDAPDFLKRAQSVIDPVNAVITANGVRQSCTGGAAPKTSKVDSETLAYDELGRLASDSKAQTGPCATYFGTRTRTTTYDAENHTIGSSEPSGTFTDSHVVTANAGWGANGHPVSLTVSYLNSPSSEQNTLHYDGDQLLFTTNAQGQLVYLNAELLGTVIGSNGLTVWDRDYAGTCVSDHIAGGYNGWVFGSSAHSSELSGADSDPPSIGPSPNGAHAFPTEWGLYKNPDGFESPFGTIQGVRVSSQLGAWTTPDAYAGDVHDPMSQKSYMFNRNNPFQYSDPTGFDAIVKVEGNNVDITLNVKFTGVNINDQEKAAIVKEIETAFTKQVGKYNVTMHVVEVSTFDTGSKVNEFYVQRGLRMMGGSGSRKEIDAGFPRGASHEAGHAMHLEDTSKLGGRLENLTVIPRRGYENNLMTQTHQGRDLEEWQIEQIIRTNL